MTDLCEIKPTSLDTCQYHHKYICTACDKKVCGKHSTDRTGLRLCRDCANPTKPVERDEELESCREEARVLRETLININEYLSGATGTNAVWAIQEMRTIYRRGLEKANAVVWMHRHE